MATAKKLVQATLFRMEIKSGKTVHKNFKKWYVQFIDLYINIYNDINKEGAVKNAQDEWKALEKIGSPESTQASVRHYGHGDISE